MVVQPTSTIAKMRLIIMVILFIGSLHTFMSHLLYVGHALPRKVYFNYGYGLVDGIDFIGGVALLFF
ncbi:hypothetical protein ES703_99333 [subsurface metagenome]